MLLIRLLHPWSPDPFVDALSWAMFQRQIMVPFREWEKNPRL